MAADCAERQRVRGRAEAARSAGWPAHLDRQRQRRADPAGVDWAEGARSADEVHQLRRASEQLPGGQGGGYTLRQVATGDPPHRRRHLGTADPPQLLRLLLAVAAGRQRRVRLGDQGLRLTRTAPSPPWGEGWGGGEGGARGRGGGGGGGGGRGGGGGGAGWQKGLIALYRRPSPPTPLP